MKRIIGLTMIAGATYAGMKALQSSQEARPQTSQGPVEVTIESAPDNHEENEAQDFACDECDKQFDTEHGRNVHVGIVHKDNSE